MTLRPVHNGPVPLWSPAEERKEVCLLFSVDWNGDSGRREGRSEEEGGGEEKGEKRKLREKEGGGRGGRVGGGAWHWRITTRLWEPGRNLVSCIPS
jgi:hypothetical protein